MTENRSNHGNGHVAGTNHDNGHVTGKRGLHDSDDKESFSCTRCSLLKRHCKSNLLVILSRVLGKGYFSSSGVRIVRAFVDKCCTDIIY